MTNHVTAHKATGVSRPNQTGPSVRTNVKAGRIATNHNQPALTVRSRIKSGAIALNHNQSAPRI